MTDLFATNNKVQLTLEKLFQQHRLVFWYDDKAELTALFNNFQLADVEKVRIENNEFSLKYRLLIEQPRQKSINRIRIQGAGSRFVHGGSCLQEIVIPVLEINNTRKEDLTQVEIDIISGSSTITSNTLGVRFYQKQPVTEKIQPRQLKAGFYTEGGKLISDIVTLPFNSTDTDAMAREKRQVFLFTSDASKYNGQDIHLKLEEQIGGTHQFRTYKSLTYRMSIAFSSEFDD